MLWLLQKAEVTQPLLESRGPFAGGVGVLFAHAEAMARGGVNVQLSRHANLFELQIDFGHTLRDVGTVFISAHDEDRRRIFSRSESARASGVDQRLKIRLGAFTLYRVGGLFVTAVETHARERRQLAARREAHHSDARRIDVPFRRAA